MKTEQLVKELEELIEQIGYSVRKEKGTFIGSHCIMEGQKLVVINKKRPVEMQVGIYARVLKDKNLDDIYVKPAVRKELEELWERMEEFEDS